MRELVCPPRRMRFSFGSRCRLVELVREGIDPQAAAAACGASRATGYRWWRRYRQGGWSCACRSSVDADPAATPAAAVGRSQEILRLACSSSGAGPAGDRDGLWERPASTVGKVLRRAGSSRMPRAGRDRRVRYERERPGELLHVDTKKLGRFWQVGKRIREDGVAALLARAGWQHLHIAIDDHTRLAYAEVLPSERKHDCAAFLAAAVAWYAEQ